MRVLKGFLVVLFAIAVVACSEDQEVRLYSLSYIFKDSVSGWTGDFADYPVDSAGYHLHSGLETLPIIINKDSTKKAIRISGVNKNQDLFMFIKRKVAGLKKNTSYELLFSVRIASNAPTGGVDTIGLRGENVYLKVGAATEEPEKTIVGGNYILNLDKGNQSAGGANMIVLGHVGVAATTKDYAIITRYNTTTSSNLVISTNEAGELWLIVGTDSGFKGETTLYYTQIDVLLNQID